MIFLLLKTLCDTLIFNKDSFDSINIGDYTIYNYDLEKNYCIKISFLGTEDKFTFYKRKGKDFYFKNKNSLKIVYERKYGILFENDIRLGIIIAKCIFIAALVWLTAFKLFKW